ncbi:MAG: NYN domain-containing protein [Elusimicrobiaceae bacterium]|nr:NYN domain-containing protein [Elusimicrobiaceae bacterium]
MSKLSHSLCGGHEEKLTDVNIAIYLLEIALKNTVDEAVIVSADSDLIPAILAIKRNFPGKKSPCFHLFPTQQMT